MVNKESYTKEDLISLAKNCKRSIEERTRDIVFASTWYVKQLNYDEAYKFVTKYGMIHRGK
ncbi:hypothetical protein LCGC14_1458000 [marine sediment metagenome]|uniref:Uncharacterized protein n=1 Tax=marine sediment metagenome TaxID=412755 RepID=A0A0F9K220_9ZZZZ